MFRCKLGHSPWGGGARGRQRGRERLVRFGSRARWRAASGLNTRVDQGLRGSVRRCGKLSVARLGRSAKREHPTHVEVGGLPFGRVQVRAGALAKQPADFGAAVQCVAVVGQHPGIVMRSQAAPPERPLEVRQRDERGNLTATPIVMQQGVERLGVAPHRVQRRGVGPGGFLLRAKASPLHPLQHLGVFALGAQPRQPVVTAGDDHQPQQGASHPHASPAFPPNVSLSVSSSL